MHAHKLTAGQKTVENLDRAAGPSWAAGRWAAGRWAAGLSRAVGCGPLGRGPVFSKTRGILPSFRPIMLHKSCFLKVLHQAELYNEHEDKAISEVMPNETVCFPSLKSHYLPPLIGLPFWKQDFPVVFSISPFPSSSALPPRALPCVTLKTTGDDRYNKLLTNLACSSLTGEYWLLVVFCTDLAMLSPHCHDLGPIFTSTALALG